ncbi:hypothetical protein EUX98_g1626 [Antrodiella citrinella]|uniref:Uncharacterized protein n=1 Tax=Antrodiella citrinella TaxID=2447956 RepID=A0A4S4N3D7_9APHY|nr:hypothetical protein EUX98_g1626 [Antrodiella citrinella]
MTSDLTHAPLNSGHKATNDCSSSGLISPTMQLPGYTKPLLQWDWDIEHQDRRREAKADAVVHNTQPFQVDRKLLKDIVHEKMGTEVARVQFLGAGTFHKGYLITLVDGAEVVARVARRFMPNLKTESEVATMRYLRERSNVPVPTVYHHDSNPYNRLGGEFIIMSKAVGVPLSKVFHTLDHNQLTALMQNMAMLLIPLFGHRFPKIGSLYFDADSEPDSEATPTVPTPTATQATPTAAHFVPRAFAMTPTMSARHSGLGRQHLSRSDYHVGPIISWPFFGSNRGELEHPQEINRGPWPSTYSYLISCVAREITGVIRENEGKAAPHKLHLDPDEVHSSRHHHTMAVPDDTSDNSDEWDWEESEEEWEGPGDTMYRDYRRMQRSTFLVAHMKEREERVQEEMSRFVRLMEKLGVQRREEGDGGGGGGGGPSGGEQFTLDCHDLSLENVFVDETDPSKITSIIDWESTTTRPLWAAAHVPALLQSSPFTAKLFRAVVEKMAHNTQTVMVNGEARNLADIAQEWLHHEASGVRMRMAHRCAEWDGWEEGLVDSILGPEDQEDDWFVSWEDAMKRRAADEQDDGPDSPSDSPELSTSPTLFDSGSEPSSDGSKHHHQNSQRRNSILVIPPTTKPLGRAAVPLVAKVVALEKEKEKLLNATGDFCGGRGGELGRRLDAWLTTNGDAEGRVELPRRWRDDDAKVVSAVAQ